MSSVWLSRTLPHLIMSELADASGKSAHQSHTQRPDVYQHSHIARPRPEAMGTTEGSDRTVALWTRNVYRVTPSA